MTTQKKELQKRLQKHLTYAYKEGWEGMINWILEIADRENIELI